MDRESTDCLEDLHDIFVCIRCLQAGFTREEATYPISKAVYHDFTSDPWCPHCYCCECEREEEKDE
jgi:hypothetical protein